jgi:hypothetical protein
MRRGYYSPTAYLEEAGRAMNEVGTYGYAWTLNRTTRIATVTAGTIFTLRCATTGNAAWTMVGASTLSNKTGALTYAMDTTTGSEFSPQFWLQDYVDSDHYRAAVDQVVRTAVDGSVEVVRWGRVRFTQFNISRQTNVTMPSNAPIENDADGVESLLAFVDFITTKGKFEFMKDRAVPGTYKTLMLESFPGWNDGTGYMLKELYAKGMPGYFETGILKLRVF